MNDFDKNTDVASLFERREQLAPYNLHLVQLLASGAFAEVYRVEQTETKKAIAAKVYYELSWEHRIRHANREFTVVHDLQHDNIVHMFELFVADDVIFTTMELMEGGELLDHITAFKGLSPEFGQSVLIDVCNGMRYIHEEKGLVHLDVKPENILLTSNMKAKLADFDAAVLEGTFVQTVRGTSECHPHEYLPNGDAGYIIRRQADVWALGLVVYEVLVGQYPWESPSRADDGYRGYKDALKTTEPWSNMNQRILDMFDCMFTEDVEARADTVDVLAYALSFYLEDAVEVQGRISGKVQEEPREDEIEPIEQADFVDPELAKLRAIALRAWSPELNRTSEWTVLIDPAEHESHDRYLVIGLPPNETSKKGRIVCEERYSRLLALHRMCTAYAPQITPRRFPKKKVFGRRTVEFLHQRASDLADYFEEAFSQRECLDFYTGLSEFVIVPGDPTLPDFGKDDITPLFGEGWEFLNVSRKPSWDTQSSTSVETLTMSNSNGSISISPLDTAAFEGMNIYNDFIDYPKEIIDSGKNRYNNVLPHLSTRVVLKGSTNNDATSDYINANFVKDLDGQNTYIATQGPLSKTCVDFWRMVWQEQIPLIVMLTSLHHGSKEKCARYWPHALGQTIKFGNISIKYLKSIRYKGYSENALEVSCAGHKQPLRVTHFECTSWPDYGVPSTKDGRVDPSDLLEIIQSVRLKRLLWRKDTPIVVHCSSGIGRSGTFILVDLAIESMERTRSVDLLQLLDQMRQCRMALVQRTSQYKLAWQAVAQIAQRMTEGVDGTVYALGSRMSQRLSIQMRRSSMRSNGEWSMQRLDNDDVAYQLKNTAKAVIVSEFDDVKYATTNHPSPMKKAEHQKRKKCVQTFELADVGSRVSVSGYCEGTLRFVGFHHIHNTPRVGVELDKPIGKNNGRVNEHTYFECEEKHGIMCVPNKVAIVRDKPVSRQVIPHIIAEDVGTSVLVDGCGTGVLKFCGPRFVADGLPPSAEVVCGVALKTRVGQSNGLFANHQYYTCADGHGVLVPINKVKRVAPNARDIGQLVSVKGYDCLGVLQFYGAHKEKGHVRCGVELEQPIGKNDGTVNGNDYFVCENLHGVLCSPKKVSLYYDEVLTPSFTMGTTSA